jgi:hypothetical protein
MYVGVHQIKLYKNIFGLLFYSNTHIEIANRVTKNSIAFLKPGEIRTHELLMTTTPRRQG